MQLASKAPTWSIKDDQGFITVILQWEHGETVEQEMKMAATKVGGSMPHLLDDYAADETSWSRFGGGAPPSYAQLAAAAAAASVEKVYSSTFPRPSFRRSASARRAPPTPLLHPSASLLPPYRALSADDFSLGLTSSLTVGGDELTSSAHDLPSTAFSFCDFHCSSLHREGGSIRVSSTGSVASVGTSPIPELSTAAVTTRSRTTSPLIPFTTSSQLGATTTHSVPPPFTTPPFTSSGGTAYSSTSPQLLTAAQLLAGGDASAQLAQQIPVTTTMKAGKKAGVHVRFLDIDDGGGGHGGCGISRPLPSNISLIGQLLNGHQTTQQRLQQQRQLQNQTSLERTPSSEESETETTEREDEQLRERYLLLVDSQISSGRGGGQHASQNHRNNQHLSVKDIGIILERLRSKIVDVDRLEREKDEESVTTSTGSGTATGPSYNWLLRATIRGEMLREIGVVYNGRYYGLMEHPAYF